MRDAQSTKQGKYERGNAMSTTLKKQAKSTNERDQKIRMTNNNNASNRKEKQTQNYKQTTRY